jgi:hypothetical protein
MKKIFNIALYLCLICSHTMLPSIKAQAQLLPFLKNAQKTTLLLISNIEDTRLQHKIYYSIIGNVEYREALANTRNFLTLENPSMDDEKHYDKAVKILVPIFQRIINNYEKLQKYSETDYTTTPCGYLEFLFLKELVDLED